MEHDIQELLRRNQRLSFLYDIALTVGSSLELREILDRTLEKIVSFMEADAGVIYVIDEDSLEMIPVSYRNLSPEVVEDLSANRVRVGECVCGHIAETEEEIVITEKASGDPRFTRATLRAEGMEFYAGLPLTAAGNVVGVLCVITHLPYRADPELLDLLRAATTPIALAIDNARVFEKTKRTASLQAGLCRFQGIIANSAPMKEVLDLVRKVMDSPSSLLIYGESGTGKELIARAVHVNSARRDRPFIAVNCSAIPETLLESEFFGHVRGAFTGAVARKKGLFEAADGGSIFLDEVEAMSPGLQAKLLRVLQDGRFHKIGSTSPSTVDVRVIAATNRDLEQAVREGRFREDLYYRLNVIRVDLPPLRDRAEDIPLLARHFLHKTARRAGRNIRRISDEAMAVLVDYDWPGNVRQLENAMERAVTVAESDEIGIFDLPAEVSSGNGRSDRGWRLESVERAHIMKVLNITGGNKRKAARLLGIDHSTLWRKLRRYDGKG